MRVLLKYSCNKSIFHSCGSLPWVREALNINARAGAMLTEVSFRNLSEMPSGPEAL